MEYTDSEGRLHCFIKQKNVDGTIWIEHTIDRQIQKYDPDAVLKALIDMRSRIRNAVLASGSDVSEKIE